MGADDGRGAAPELESRGNGVWGAPGARIIDRSGRKRLPIGYDGWARAMEGSVLVDKTMLAADVLDSGYAAGVYWGNTSSNSVLGAAVAAADEETLSDVYSLCEPGGTVEARLDLGTVFPDDGSVPAGALWSMLYLSGYVTTDEPAHTGVSEYDPYELRLPNLEVAMLFRGEIADRFSREVGAKAGAKRARRA